MVLEGIRSEEANGLSGITQESVLGPILFSIFINDLLIVIDLKVMLFTDDCIVYRLTRKNDDAEYLQADINRLMKWAEKWSMLFILTNLK